MTGDRPIPERQQRTHEESRVLLHVERPYIHPGPVEFTPFDRNASATAAGFQVPKRGYVKPYPWGDR